MSFQAYLDNIEEKTGKTPNDFIAEAKKKNITEFKDIIAWLKQDYSLGTGQVEDVKSLGGFQVSVDWNADYSCACGGQISGRPFRPVISDDSQFASDRLHF